MNFPMYFLVFLISVITCASFYDRKILVWSPPIIFFVNEIVAILYEGIIGGNFNGVFRGETAWFTVYMYPQFFAIALFCSIITVLIRYFRKRRKSYNIYSN